MKKKYTLIFRTGWGETVRQDFNAYTITEALTMARNFLVQRYISVGWLYSPEGKKYLV